MESQRVSDVDPVTDVNIPYAVFGLYRDVHTPRVFFAADEAGARRQYHDAYPGWEGTTFKVQNLLDAMEVGAADE